MEDHCLLDTLMVYHRAKNKLPFLSRDKKNKPFSDSTNTQTHTDRQTELMTDNNRSPSKGE